MKRTLTNFRKPGSVGIQMAQGSSLETGFENSYIQVVGVRINATSRGRLPQSLPICDTDHPTVREAFNLSSSHLKCGLGYGSVFHLACPVGL